MIKNWKVEMIQFYKLTKIILCWRNNWDYITVEGWQRLYCIGGGDWDYIVLKEWRRLYYSGGVTEIILYWRGDWVNIVLEGWLRLYNCGGVTEIILCWRRWLRLYYDFVIEMQSEVFFTQESIGNDFTVGMHSKYFYYKSALLMMLK